jgi:FkbM family methyltransferase
MKKIKYFKHIVKKLEHFLNIQTKQSSELIDKSLGSQKGQVEFLINNFFNYEENGLKKNGYFVDLASGDGVRFSNTYFLEQYLEWTGILIEPNPKFAENIKSYRTSKFLDYCIGDKDNEEVKFRIDNLMLGGIVGDSYDNNLRYRAHELEKAEIIKLKTRSLTSVLNEENSPRIIDYLSLDVEGAEELILSNFNFKKYRFKFISIERPTKKIDLILDSNDYVQLNHLKSEVYYCHREYLKYVNLSPKLTFKITEQKDW